MSALNLGVRFLHAKNVVEDLEKQADLLSLESGQEYTNTWSITIKEK